MPKSPSPQDEKRALTNSGTAADVKNFIGLQGIDAANARERRRPFRWAAMVVVGLASASVLSFMITAEQLEWPVVWRYLFNEHVMNGLALTIILAIIVQINGIVLGTIGAILRLASFPLSRWIGTTYVTIFRSVPALVQLLFWFNIAYLIPNIAIGIPFIDVTFASWPTNDVVTPMIAAIVALSLLAGANMTEIIRGSILSVGAGQRDAALALGYSPAQMLGRIVLPQSVRIAIPPTGSEFISAIHATALVSVISVADLLFSVQNIYQRTYQIVPLLLVAVIWYLVITLSLTYFQQKLERRLGRQEGIALQPRKLKQKIKGKVQ